MKAAVALLVASILMASSVQAASVSVQVRAAILPYLEFSAVQSVSHYQVTAAEIKRGHIDLPGAVTLHYQTNIGDDLLFEVASEGPARITIPQAGGGSLRVRGMPGVAMTSVLNLRVLLDKETTEGSYPLQIALLPTVY